MIGIGREEKREWGVEGGRRKGRRKN